MNSNLLCLIDKLKFNVVFDLPAVAQKCMTLCSEKVVPYFNKVFGGELSYLRASRLQFTLEDELPLSIGV